jgi:hypothetical protein
MITGRNRSNAADPRIGCLLADAQATGPELAAEAILAQWPRLGHCAGSALDSLTSR